MTRVRETLGRVKFHPKGKEPRRDGGGSLRNVCQLFFNRERERTVPSWRLQTTLEPHKAGNELFM